MHAKLYKLMKNYSAYPMMLCSKNVKPGMLLQTEWDWFSNPTKFVGEEGYPWKLLGMSKKADRAAYIDKLSAASIIVGDIVDKIEFGANLALPQFGFSTSASFAEKRVAKLIVDGVKVRSFKVGFAQHELRLALRKLKGSDPTRWGWVDDDFLVTDSFYTSGLRFEFKKEGGFNAEVTYKKLEKDISAGFKHKWQNDTTLILKGTAKVPFAVRGIKV